MCGIFGLYSSENLNSSQIEKCEKSTLSLRHRGPDSGSSIFKDNYFLGHRRLSILDLSESSNQPMLDQNGELIIVFNGEIYNYLELKDELRQLGHEFRTQGDTEVLLKAYRQWGTNLSERLNGMFAFAILDKKQNRLVLSRDRFGEKPLFYFSTPKSFGFASEFKALTPFLSKEEKAIDYTALNQYLSLNYVPGERTLLQPIRKVNPGETLVLEEGKITKTRYWNPPNTVEPLDSTLSLEEEFARRLDIATRLCLRSDVPVGLFLSGGIDSSIVAESACRQGQLKQAFTVDFNDKNFSEWDNASLVAKKLNLQIERVLLEPKLLQEFLQIAAHCDDPLADSSALPLWLISKTASQKFKVVLSGDGGDELFAGYLTYQASDYHRRYISKMPRTLRQSMALSARLLPVNSRKKVSSSYKLMRFLRAADTPTALAHLTWNGTWLPRDIQSLVSDEKYYVPGALNELPERLGIGFENTSLHELQILDAANYLPNDILTKVDRMTMAHGLEARAPLLNPVVAEFALKLPLSDRISSQNGLKSILRHHAEKKFGRRISHAKKQGFSIPVHQWLRKEMREQMLEILSLQRLEKLEFLNPQKIIEIRDLHLHGTFPYGYELWGLMILVLWYENHILSDLNIGQSSKTPIAAAEYN